MEAEKASRHETPKRTGISASPVIPPADLPESAISSTPEGSGSLRRDSAYRLIGGNRPFPRIGSVAFDRPYITCLRATKYFDGLGLKIPWRAFPRHERDAILEVKLVRCLEPSREAILYMKQNPDDRKGDLALHQLRAKYGEEFWVTSIGEYSQRRFACDYSRMRPKGLENTELLWKDGLRIRVDETELGLNVRRMKPFQGELAMDADFEGAGLITIRKVVDGFSVRAKNHYLVRSMMVDGRDVLMTYRTTDGRMHVSAVSVPRLVEVAGAGRVRFRDGVKVVSRPKAFEGEYLVEVDSRLVAHILARLTRCRKQGYTKEKGDIGEELSDAILWNLDCPQLMSHPLDPGRDFDSSRKGPDSLRQIFGGWRAYFEFKWWNNIVLTEEAARQQLASYQLQEQVARSNLKGAYSGILEWDTGSRNGHFYLSRVW